MNVISGEPASGPAESEFPLGRRIAVFGKGGKTTLARALANRFGLVFVELDAIRHLPDWQERPDDEMREFTASLLEGADPGWVVDGNYAATRELILSRVETVIVLALPWRVMLWRTFKRSVRRLVTREKLYNGNRESIRVTFLSGDSVVYDLWRRRNHFRNIEDEFGAQTPEGVALHVIRTTGKLARFYEDYVLRRV